MPCRASARTGRDLGEQHAGHRHRGRRQVLVRRDRILGRQRAHPPQRLETDRTHHDQLFGHRLEQQFHLADQRCQVGLDPGRRHQFFEGFQPGAALAAERDGVRLAGASDGRPEHGCLCGPSPSRSADTRSCSWIVTFCISLYASLRLIRFVRPVREPGWAPAALASIPRRIAAGKRLTGVLSAAATLTLGRAARRTASALLRVS